MPDAEMARLFRPFERGLVGMPGRNERWLVLGAPAGFHAPPEFAARLSFVQGFRPHFLALDRAGFDVSPEPQGLDFDGALVLFGRSRRENELHLGEALQRVRPGGVLVAAGGKTEGAASLRKRVGDFLELGGHAAKHHGEAFWLVRPDRIDGAAAELFAPRDETASNGRFFTAEGGFSAGEVDRGSQTLAEHLPADIAGAVADFGAGWGYLACAVAKNPGITALDLYEAHHASLEAARRNLRVLASGVPCGFFWLDLLQEPVGRRYDTIVMNPPFHYGRAADPRIGTAMIEAAASALEPGGRLVMVANRALPYETTLRQVFTAHGELFRNEGFKVLWGRR